MAPKRSRGRLEEVDKEQEEQTPRKKQLKFHDEQEQEQEEEDDKESKTDSNKVDGEEAVDVSKPQQEAVAIVEEDEKKPVINRLWSLDDEIAVLQGLIDFNKDNSKNQDDDFFNFVKGKLNYTKFTKAQVKDKVQKLKKKYKKNHNKSESDPRFSNPHDLKCFQLSKRIWVHRDAKAGCALVQDQEDDIIRVDDENKGKDLRRLYPHLNKAFEGECFPKVMPLDVFKTSLSKVDTVVLEEWDRKWKKVHLAEIHAYLTRLALIQEQANWFYNQMKSS